MAATTATQTRFFPKDLRGHLHQIHAFGDSDVVRTVGRNNNVFMVQVCTNTYSTRLLPIREMHLARNRAFRHVEGRGLALHVNLLYRLLKESTDHHMLVHPDFLFLAWCHLYLPSQIVQFLHNQLTTAIASPLSWAQKSNPLANYQATVLIDIFCRAGGIHVRLLQAKGTLCSTARKQCDRALRSMVLNKAWDKERGFKTLDQSKRLS